MSRAGHSATCVPVTVNEILVGQEGHARALLQSKEITRAVARSTASRHTGSCKAGGSTWDHRQINTSSGIHNRSPPNQGQCTSSNTNGTKPKEEYGIYWLRLNCDSTLRVLHLSWVW